MLRQLPFKKSANLWSTSALRTTNCVCTCKYYILKCLKQLRIDDLHVLNLQSISVYRFHICYSAGYRGQYRLQPTYHVRLHRIWATCTYFICLSMHFQQSTLMCMRVYMIIHTYMG